MPQSPAARRPGESAAMAQAIALGGSVLGRTSPNPPVGAVVLDVDGRVVGEGATSPAGGPHAEIHAIRAAGEATRGGTLLSTLEPCAHTGRTPPCSAAIVAAGIGRVVYAVPEPTGVAGGGGSRLHALGVEVEAGLLAAEAAAGALLGWLHAVTHARPHVTWKYAATLDGRVAAADGSSRWITGPEARADGHRLRAESDAVLVGSGTVLTDRPQLTVRDRDGRPAGHQPLRVVLDRSHRLTASDTDLLVLSDPEPVDALHRLYDRGVRTVLLEGGPTLAGVFVAAGLVDRVVGYLAPKLLGAGPAVLGAAGMDRIDQALNLQLDDVARVGADLRIVATPRRED